MPHPDTANPDCIAVIHRDFDLILREYLSQSFAKGSHQSLHLFFVVQLSAFATGINSHLALGLLTVTISNQNNGSTETRSSKGSEQAYAKTDSFLPPHSLLIPHFDHALILSIHDPISISYSVNSDDTGGGIPSGISSYQAAIYVLNDGRILPSIYERLSSPDGLYVLVAVMPSGKSVFPAAPPHDICFSGSAEAQEHEVRK